MRASAITIVLAVCAGPMPARADRLTELPAIGPAPSLKKRITLNLNDYSNELGAQFERLSAGLLRLHFDIKRRHARIGLGGGDPDAFRLRLDSDVQMGDGKARIQARLDLAVAGHHFNLDVPALDMAATSVGGRRALQLNLPVLQGSF
jgi:hypothetical protein